MTEALQMRIHGETNWPTLIYLPGLHGDWTLIGDLRSRLAGRVRFVEFTYPRTLTWSLDDYAAAIQAALAKQNIHDGWLLGESYGSQILWQLTQASQFQTRGVILAGGFVKHPWLWGVRLVQFGFGRIPLRVLLWSLAGYSRFARWRYRHAPETLANVDEFIARRTKLDRQAALHRLELIAGNDPGAIARTIRVPVYYLSGWLDPIVPWPLVRNWLRKYCPALRESIIIGTADHNVLATAAGPAAEFILKWMQI